MKRFLADETATIALGQELADLVPNDLFLIHLEGELGAGKTTFTRGFLRGLGYGGNVKSPTYTLVEQYQLKQRPVYHFDLYRLSDPEELDFLGMDDYLSQNAICLIEWPQRGHGFLPDADLLIQLTYHDKARTAELIAQSDSAERVLENLKNN